VGKPFLFLSERVWPVLSPFARFQSIYQYGAFIQSLVRLREPRQQYHGTYFFRNRPELALMRALADQKALGSTLQLSVVACSNGAEVYSIVSMLRLARPDLKLVVHAIDISDDVLQMAKEGLYSQKVHEQINSQVFERLTDHELQTMFDEEDDQFRIKSWLKEGIDWQVGDAADPELLRRLGPQDIVVANRFLCHMNPLDAERCLRSVAKLVAPGGYLFVSGVDLDIRTKVALDLGWIPVTDLLEEIHNGDPSLTRDWPWRYWGLEPFSRNRPAWNFRYASVFRLGQEKCAPELSLVSSESQ